jgi:Transposase DDE domain/Domain of unknown function (DUF4372)
MDKSTHFFGQSVFGQLISLINESLINTSIKHYQANRYVKKFTTKDQLISMLFCVFSKCNSLREVCGAMLGLKGKTKHFSLSHLPRRSTLSDANKLRTHEVFASIYYGLLKQYKQVISDSRFLQAIQKQVKIFDSTTISLFQEIMRCVGRNPQSGKRKGGIKVHTIINVDEKVPEVIWYTDARTHDHTLLSKLRLDEKTIYVFDLGYTDYKMYYKFTQHKTGFTTRLKDNALYEHLEELNISDEVYEGVIKDELIEVQVKLDNGIKEKLKLRRIAFWDDKDKRVFVYLTNLLDMRPDMIAALYKIRWQIELLFKQLKQNFPLRYFLGDNENAIKIQIWCALIANLLLTVVQKIIKKRKWSFSNIVIKVCHATYG